MSRIEPRIEVVQADITTLDVDVVVNAANQSLAGGGGVDGAIHRAAGAKALHAACAEIGGCPTGEARLTPGFALRARWIAHAVGPRWRDGRHGEAEKLAGAYRGALELAAQKQAASIAFPAISTGIYGYPPDEAARVALDAIEGFLADHETPERVILCAFDARSAQTLRAALETR